MAFTESRVPSLTTERGDGPPAPRGVLRTLGRAGAPALGEPEEIPRRVHPAQRAARGGHARWTGKEQRCDRAHTGRRHGVMTWVQRLSSASFASTSSAANAKDKVRIIASIEDPQLVGKLLPQLEQREPARGCTG